jgi:hypothetical protein
MLKAEAFNNEDKFILRSKRIQYSRIGVHLSALGRAILLDFNLFLLVFASSTIASGYIINNL